MYLSRCFGLITPRSILFELLTCADERVWRLELLHIWPGRFLEGSTMPRYVTCNTSFLFISVMAGQIKGDIVGKWICFLSLFKLRTINFADRVDRSIDQARISNEMI
ncbi:hypothetical protein OG21DRAFT_211807 [Imleria badia]|nr:hypothetical protein OG21DRAFT_211807 [Imleria badia]